MSDAVDYVAKAAELRRQLDEDNVALQQLRREHAEVALDAELGSEAAASDASKMRVRIAQFEQLLSQRQAAVLVAEKHAIEQARQERNVRAADDLRKGCDMMAARVETARALDIRISELADLIKLYGMQDRVAMESIVPHIGREALYSLSTQHVAQYVLARLIIMADVHDAPGIAIPNFALTGTKIVECDTIERIAQRDVDRFTHKCMEIMPAEKVAE